MKHEPLIFFHLKLVAKICLAIGTIATIALLIALTMVTDQSGDTYSAVVQVQYLKSENLGKVMLLAGLVLVAMTSFTTWLITLYSSFRIAGPLYRLSKNFQSATMDESATPIDLREGDALRQEAEIVKQALLTLRAYHAAVTTASQQAADAMAAGDEAGYAQAVASLRMLDEKVRI